MEEASVIAGLLAKREQIGKRIVALRREIAKHKADTKRVDAAILLFAKDVTAAKRKASHFARSEHFISGELTRRVREGLRQSREPLTADDLALLAMRDKGFAETDTAIKLDFAQRFGWTLTRMLAHHRVEKIGRGPEATWKLPQSG